MPNPKDPPLTAGGAPPSAGLVRPSGPAVDRLAGGDTVLAHVLRRVAAEAAVPGTGPRAPFESSME
ncbi:hypothetical protein ACFV6E_03125 [Streptomyces sp. NPDC059785]|uniref:hypothetical protein n=1 Tax=unclassified Streptomyces TaxID=2593676 RepID=UPI0036531D5A